MVEPTRSVAKGAKAGCAPGKFKNNTKSPATNLDLMPTLHSFGRSSTILVGRISPGRVVNRTWNELTRSAARGAETGCAPGRFEKNSKSSATSLDLIPTLRSFGTASTTQVGRILTGRMLALHVLPVCAYSAPACLYLAFVCVFASLLVAPATACSACALLVLECPGLVCACFCCACACAFPRVLSLHLIFSSIAATTIGVELHLSIMGTRRRHLQLARGSIYSG